MPRTVAQNSVKDQSGHILDAGRFLPGQAPGRCAVGHPNTERAVQARAAGAGELLPAPRNG